MLIETCVPDGLRAGDEFICEVESRTFHVCVPEGSAGGSMIQVDLPTEEELDTLVEVVVPNGCWPGDWFQVQYDGMDFEIAVPEMSAPGDVVKVQLPREPEEAGKEAWEDTNEETTDDCGSDDSLPYGPCSVNGLITGSHLYWVGQSVEVFRSSGKWTAAEVEDYDYAGDTYTVAVHGPAGQRLLKSFVSADELRAAQSGAYRRGQLVDALIACHEPTLYCGARVDEYEAETDCYTLRFVDPTSEKARFLIARADEICRTH